MQIARTGYFAADSFIPDARSKGWFRSPRTTSAQGVVLLRSQHGGPDFGAALPWSFCF